MFWKVKINIFLIKIYRFKYTKLCQINSESGDVKATSLGNL